MAENGGGVIGFDEAACAVTVLEKLGARMTANRRQHTIGFALAHEVAWPRDPAADPAGWGMHHANLPPFNRLLGPEQPHGDVSGLVLQHGIEIAAWGQPTSSEAWRPS